MRWPGPGVRLVKLAWCARLRLSWGIQDQPAPALSGLPGARLKWHWP
jgi:hypothetical protein